MFTLQGFLVCGVRFSLINLLLSLDKAIGKIFKTCEETGYVLMITADHGNAEQMYSEKGGPHTAHTTNRGTCNLETTLKLDLFIIHSVTTAISKLLVV